MKRLVAPKTSLLAASLLALGWTTAASAQDAAGATGQATNAGETPPASGFAQDEDIIVTATKRAETISRVPLSIAAFSQENLDARGVRSAQDVVNQTPGIDLSRTGVAGSQNRVVIRGIDSTAGAATSAVYVDDTPIQARNSSLNYNGTVLPYIFDIDRVEVLRGPQGTLFGASSEGGALRFITPTPSLTEYSGYGRAAVNTVDGGDIGYEGGVALGGPIIADKLGFRVSGYYRRDGGWIDRQSWEDPANRASNVNSSTAVVGRAALRFEPAPWLSISPSLYYQNLKFDDQATLWIKCPATTGSPLNPSRNPCPNGNSNTKEGRFLSYAPLAEPSHDRFYLPALKVVGEWGSTSVTSVTSWFTRHVNDINDATNINARTYFGTGTLVANNYLFPVTANAPLTIGVQYPDIRQRSFTQEVRLTGGAADSWLRYTAGVYYSRSSVASDVPITLPTYPLLYQTRFGIPAPAAKYMVGDAIYYGQEYTVERSIAGFANIDIRVLPRVTVSAGARYSHDTLDFAVTERGVSFASSGGVSSVIGRQRSRPLLPKATLSFQATPQSLYYFTYSEGYRTGGVNKTLPSTCTAEAAQLGISPATFDPDKTRNYEVGAKNRLLGGAVQYELSAYYIKWQNIQQQLRLNCAFSLVTNTGSATSKGFDANVTVRPTRELTMGIAAGYTSATYDQNIQIGAAPITVVNQSLGATPWTVNLNGEYHLLGMSHQPYVRGQFNFKSASRGLFLYQIPTATTFDPTRVYPDDYMTLDLRAGLSFEHFNVALYAENLLNYAGYTVLTPQYATSALVKGNAIKPRTIGVQLFARF